MNRRLVLHAFGAALTGLPLLACGEAAPASSVSAWPTPTKTPMLVQPGYMVDAQGWRHTARGAHRLDTIPGDLGGPHKPRGQYIVAGITLQNLGSASARLDSTDFVLVDDKGTTYDMVILPLAADWAKAQGFDGGLLVSSTGTLPPNVPVTFGLPFDVTPGAKGLKLRLVKSNVDMVLPAV